MKIPRLTIHMLFLIYIQLTVGFVLTGCSGSSWNIVKTNTFDHLEQIRTHKKEIILNRLESLLVKVHHAEKDSVLLAAFQLLGDTSGFIKPDNSVLRKTLDGLDLHFVSQYGEFYDILLIKKSGYVFHSIRMESDFHSNLFSGPLSATKLAYALRETPVPRFVDYDYYIPSAEPASFFITPIKSGTKELGWIAFQLPINTINNVMTKHDGLGRTGEAYLTNNKKLMLTQSRLLGQDTIFKLPVDTLATTTAIDRGIGNLLLDDYRKIRVFSSFEKLEFQGVSWILIVEMDEDEVITNQFRENPEYYMEKVFKKLTPGQIMPNKVSHINSNAVRVDINEYAKGKDGRQLWTKGVATCTGVVITYPDHFSYLGHISPLDSAYFSSANKTLAKFGYWVRGEDIQANSFDLLGEMLDNINKFDVTKAQLRDIKIVLIAVHKNSFVQNINRLLDSGVFLSQIKILYAGEMEYANIFVTSAQEPVSIEWGNDSDQKFFRSRDKETQSLGDLVKSI
ncbi:MAG: hypothetical protein HQL68_03765 [Magnetococcales bacterium]|nr:hypothetical protein [Magnetococcales bacterium]